MGLLVATVLGLIVWLIGWALGGQALDWFMLAVGIVMVAATGRIVAPHLPGRGTDE